MSSSEMINKLQEQYFTLSPTNYQGSNYGSLGGLGNFLVSGQSQALSNMTKAYAYPLAFSSNALITSFSVFVDNKQGVNIPVLANDVSFTIQTYPVGPTGPTLIFSNPFLRNGVYSQTIETKFPVSANTRVGVSYSYTGTFATNNQASYTIGFVPQN